MNERPPAFRCRSCRSSSTVLVIDLGQVPASDIFPSATSLETDEAWPLRVYFCHSCALIQLGPDAELQPEEPGPVNSSTSRAHAAASVARVLAEERPEAGGTFIEHDSGHGGSWRPDFMSAGLRPAAEGQSASLVADVHHLMHELDLDAVLAARAREVAPGGVLVCEFFHGRPMVADTLVDTVRHGHYVYLTLTAAIPALRRHGLVVTRAAEVPAYGGSLRLTARRAADRPHVDASVGAVLRRERADGLDTAASLVAMAHRGHSVATAFRAYMQRCANAGLSVAAYGAPSKAPVLLALSGVDKSLLPYAVDLSPAKSGRRIPGAGVPILPVSTLLERRPDVVVVLTWDIADEITDQLREMCQGRTGWSPTLYIPLPHPREQQLWDAAGPRRQPW